MTADLMERGAGVEETEVGRMARKIQLSLFVAIAIALPSVGLACQFDTDCGVGSQCLKNRGSLYGVCAGGMNPGNDDDRTPVRDPLDPNDSVGDTCSFDTDCGHGNSCLKGSGQIKGVCVR